MPYVDAGIGSGGGSLHFLDHNDDYWMLSKSGGADTYVGYSHKGVAASCEPDGDDDDDDGGNSVECVCCNDCYDSGDMRYIEDAGGDVCDGCVDECYRHAITGLRGGGNYRREYLHTSNCTYVECMDEWVASGAISGIGLVMDNGSGDYIHEDDAVTCVADEETYHRDNCVKVGTDNEGVVLYLYDSRRNLERHADELYRRTDATAKEISNGLKLFWDESEEIVAWQGNEAREEWKYIRLDRWDEYVGSLHYRPVVEGVLPAPVPLPHTPSQFSEALNQLLDTPVLQMPEDLTWRQQCIVLQREGIKFERDEGGIFIRDFVCYSFNLAREKYQRVDGNPMPEDITWQSQALEMQDEGCVFSYMHGDGEISVEQGLVFSEPRDKYTVVSAPVVP